MDTSLDDRVSIVFAGALAFGLYLFSLLICFRWLLFVDEGWKLRRTQTIKWPIVIVTILILGCNLGYLLETYVWTKVAVWHTVHFPGVTYNKPEWTSIVSCTVANANVLLADIVLIIRCWILYGQRGFMIVLFPSFLWISALVCTALQIYLQIAQSKNPNIGPYSWASVNMTTGPGIVLIPFWIATVLLNAYCSAVLIRLIYKTAEDCKPSTSIEHLHFWLHVISESGILYFTITIAHFLSWFWPNHFATDIISVLNAPIIGIAFNWFLIRVARRRAAEAAKESSYNNDMSTLKFEKANQKDPEIAGVDTLSDSSSTTENSIIIISAKRASSGVPEDHLRYSKTIASDTTIEV